MSSNPIGTPAESGIYWARTRSCQWWNLIVIVRGEAPFLYLDAVWKWAEDSLVVNRRMLFDVMEIGPKIGDPPSPVLTKEEK